MFSYGLGTRRRKVSTKQSSLGPDLVVNYSWGGGLKDSPALFLLLRLREFM